MWTWTHLALFFALAGVALSDSCAIKPLLRSLARWKSTSGAYHYTAGTYDGTEHVTKRRMVFKYDAPIGYVIPEVIYRDNKEKIEAACGPMDLIQVWPGMTIATIASMESPCTKDSLPLYYGICGAQRCLETRPFPHARYVTGNWVVHRDCN